MKMAQGEGMGRAVSHHHQAVKDLEPGFAAAAYAPDNDTRSF